MSTLNLIHLSGQGDKQLFLVPKSLSNWAFAVVQQIPQGKSSAMITFPLDIQKDLSGLIAARSEVSVSDAFEITKGSAENDVYLHCCLLLDVFDSYADTLEYAFNLGFEVDERNGYTGCIY